MHVIFLILSGRYVADGKRVEMTRRHVSIDLSAPEERAKLALRKDEITGEAYWGLTDGIGGWWSVQEAFRLEEPTMELHDGQLPVAFPITDDKLGKLIAEFTRT